MIACLVRLWISSNSRWWLAAGAFGGLALTAKYTAVLLLPGIMAFVLMPKFRASRLRDPWMWLGLFCAIAIFLPVIYWNQRHDWASFRFQLDRPAQLHDWSAKFLIEFIGQQLALVGPLMIPAVVTGTALLAWRGFRTGDAIAILLSTCVIAPLGFFIWRSFYGRIGDSWPLLIWPLAFACTAINLKRWREELPSSRLATLVPAIGSGVVFVAAAFAYYLAGTANYLGENDLIGKEAGFAGVVEAADQERLRVGAGYFVTTDYRVYAQLRWQLRDRVPVIQLNERKRYLDFKTDSGVFAERDRAIMSLLPTPRSKSGKLPPPNSSRADMPTRSGEASVTTATTSER